MLGLKDDEQAFFVGIRSTFYRFAMITGQGLLIILAGYFEVSTGLPSDTITVSSKPNTQIVQNINMDSVSIKPVDGDLRLIVSQTEVQVSASRIPTTKLDSIKQRVLGHNVACGFYSIEKVKTEKESEVSVWRQYFVNPLEHFIKSNFGVADKKVVINNTAGNVGIVYFHLSKKTNR